MRLLVAGTNSGCGKTTVALSLMAALRARGLCVAPCKVGPDYIDPGFHAAACGRPSDNLDLHLLGADTVRAILARAEKSADLAVLEGVMGYYDGSGADLRCSPWEVARLTATPALLVVDAAGGAASVAATVKGFQVLTKESSIRAVLVNRASSRAHFELVRDAVARHTGLLCAGYLAKDASISLPSRHLGLVPAEETDALAEKLSRAGRAIADTVDLDMLLGIAAEAKPLADAPRTLPNLAGVRLGVARDEAFSFYYEENLRLLRASGAELVPFSPLCDAALPDGLTALYIGGGFPEVFAGRLEENGAMRGSILAALEGGMRCYAECGGLMYLSREIDGRAMVGFYPIRCRMTEKLQRFGYVNVTDAAGLSFPAHEFHHAVAEPTEDIPKMFHVSKASAPERTWECGYSKKNALAGFPHLHFGAHPELMERLFK